VSDAMWGLLLNMPSARNIHPFKQAAVY
jgi:hypothetical protein